MAGSSPAAFRRWSSAFRLLWQTDVLNAASLGSPGMDELRWVRPVRPGDTLRTVIEVLESWPSSSKPDRGVCRLKWRVLNQNGEVVLSMIAAQILARRPDGQGAEP